MPSNQDYIADKALYLDENGKVVGEGSKRKVTKLVSAGGTLPYAVAEGYGLIVTEEPAPVEVEEKAKAPAQNKAKQAAQDK